MTRNVKTISMAAGLLLAGAALADGLPNLPQALPLPQAGDSPGVVTFRHDTHVDGRDPGCVSCHPRTFGILGRSARRNAAAMTHERMEAGEGCGTCHGKQAFGFDDCTSCHAE